MPRSRPHVRVSTACCAQLFIRRMSVRGHACRIAIEFLLESARLPMSLYAHLSLLLVDCFYKQPIRSSYLSADAWISNPRFLGPRRVFLSHLTTISTTSAAGRKDSGFRGPKQACQFERRQITGQITARASDSKPSGQHGRGGLDGAVPFSNVRITQKGDVTVAYKGGTLALHSPLSTPRLGSIPFFAWTTTRTT